MPRISSRTAGGLREMSTNAAENGGLRLSGIGAEMIRFLRHLPDRVRVSVSRIAAPAARSPPRTRAHGELCSTLQMASAPPERSPFRPTAEAGTFRAIVRTHD